MKVDKTSMAHGLEVRAPFLDVKLVEYYPKIGLEYKYNRRLLERLLRIFAHDYPPQVKERFHSAPCPVGCNGKNLSRELPHIEDLKSRHIIKGTEIDKIMKIPAHLETIIVSGTAGP